MHCNKFNGAKNQKVMIDWLKLIYVGAYDPKI